MSSHIGMARIEIDPEAKQPVGTQLVDQLRYLIATGHYKVNESLPSTRALGDRLDVSFHTVRKAYQTLEDEGLLTANVGRGYTVDERTPLSKSDRIERGATVVRDTLRTLIGLGLSEEEIASLMQEQTALLADAGVERKLVAVGPHPEINAMCARQVSSALQQTVRPIPLDQLERHQDTDYAFAPYTHLPDVLEQLPRGDTLGYVTHLPSLCLERTARLLDRDALGLVTRYRGTIPPLSDALRTNTAYGGQVIAASIEEGGEHLPNVVEQTDLLLYTPATKRRLLPFLDEDAPEHEEVELIVSHDSLESIAEAVPA